MNRPIRIYNLIPAALTALVLTLPATAQPGPCGACLPVAVQPLTTEETRTLQFMREEEKLARDVYQELYKKWKLRIFDNIAKSEARHFETVGAMLVAYDVEDPALNMPAGVYKNAELTALYAKLLEQGTASLEGALTVGTVIEKEDIADLEAAVVATKKTDLKTVYTNLTAASLSHLDAFETNLEVLAAAR